MILETFYIVGLIPIALLNSRLAGKMCMAGRTIGYKDVRSLLLSARESFARCLALGFSLRRHGRLMSALSFWSYLHSFVVFASI